MPKSTPPKKTKRAIGRPAIGVEVSVTARMPAELVAKVDAWAKRQQVTRSQAIRQLLNKVFKEKP